uniref:Uncharacterized protein n=1 Tax=Setaria italica TaxID=4555 RepID=K3ZPD5_SETIT
MHMLVNRTPFVRFRLCGLYAKRRAMLSTKVFWIYPGGQWHLRLMGPEITSSTALESACWVGG